MGLRAQIIRMLGRSKEAMQALKQTVGRVGGGAGVLSKAVTQMAVREERKTSQQFLGMTLKALQCWSVSVHADRLCASIFVHF